MRELGLFSCHNTIVDCPFESILAATATVEVLVVLWGVKRYKQSWSVPLHALRVRTLIAQVRGQALAINIRLIVTSQSQLCWAAKLRGGGRT